MAKQLTLDLGEGSRKARKAPKPPAGDKERKGAAEPVRPQSEELPGTEVVAERVRPVARKVRVYVDGAARGNPGPAAAAAILKTPKGILVARIGRYLGEQTNNYAEYSALLTGLAEASRVGAGEVTVFCDSELLVRQMRGEYKVKSDTLRPLHERARRLADGFKRITFRHLERSYNKDADKLANEVLDKRL